LAIGDRVFALNVGYRANYPALPGPPADRDMAKIWIAPTGHCGKQGPRRRTMHLGATWRDYRHRFRYELGFNINDGREAL
jgi:hypothetical protein